MKISYAISVQGTAFSSVAQGDWLKKIKYLSNLGYPGVELAIRDPFKIKPIELDAALRKNRISLAAIGTGQMFLEEGLSITSVDKQIRKKAIQRIKKHIDLARDFGSQVILGLARGRTSGNKPECLRNLIESMKVISDYASVNKTIVTIEPINRYETDLFNSAQEIMEIIKRLKCGFIKILLDTFHMNIEEKDIAKAILISRGKLSHIHLADSNRRCPGQGHIDFRQVIRSLKAGDYQGYLSAEILPLPDFKVCARNYRDYIRRLL